MGRRFKVGGDTYDIPDDQVDAFTKDMGARAVAADAPSQRFTVGGEDYDIPADQVDAFRRDMMGDKMTIEPAGSTPSLERDPDEGDPDPIISDRTKVTSLPMQTLDEPDWSDKMMAGVAGFADSGSMGLPRMLPGGLGERYGANVDRAIGRAPGYGTAGRVAGAVANPINYVVPGGGFVGNAISGGVQSGVDSYAHGDPNDPDRAMNALADAGEGALVSGAVGKVLPALGGGVRKVGQAIEDSGLVNRAKAALGSGAEGFAAREGDDALTELGREIEQRGLHKGGILPQPQKTYLKNAEGLRDAAGPTMGAAEEEIAALANKPQVRADDVAEQIRARGPDAAVRDPGAAAADTRFRSKIADGLETNPEGNWQPDMDWNDALANRRNYDQQVKYQRVGKAPAKEQAYRDAADAMRGEVKGSLNRGVDEGSVPAPLRDQWIGANDDYHVGSQVLDNAEPYKPGTVEKALPLVAGGAGLATGNPTLAAAGYAGVKFVGPRADSAMAGMKGALGGATDLAGQGIEAAGQGMNGARAQGMARALSGPDSGIAQGRGNMLGEAALDALQNNPQLLGRYQTDFAQAASSPEPGAVNKLLIRLANTDAEFRQGPMQELQNMTSAGGF